MNRGLNTWLLLIIAAGVGYVAFSEYQKRQYVSDVSENMRRQVVADGIRFSIPHRNGVANYFSENESFPIAVSQLDISASQSIRPHGVLSVDLRAHGQVAVILSGSTLGLSYSDGEPVLLFTPEEKDGVLSWRCAGDGALAEHADLLPSACRAR